MHITRAKKNRATIISEKSPTFPSTKPLGATNRTPPKTVTEKIIMSEILKNVDNKTLETIIAPISKNLVESKKYYDLVTLSMESISAISVLPDIMSIFGGDKKTKKPLTKAQERFIGRVEVAKEEIDQGFPFLHNSATLMIYAQLEGSMKRLITELFKIEGVLEKVEQLKKIKIVLSEYMGLDETERFEYLFQEYEKSQCRGIQYGVKRFELLLEPFGFNGKVDDDLKERIFELSQIRNNIIHRGAIADKHLVNTCPWLNLKIGDPVCVSEDAYHIYFVSMHKYINTVLIRMAKSMGEDTTELEIKLSEM